MEEKHVSSSFSSLGAYGRALFQTPWRLARRAGSTATAQDETGWARDRSGVHMHRSLRWPDLLGLGVGGMVGAGVFVTTGRAARLYAGPAVIVSYAVAGVCALLSAFCYTEFAVDMPVAGGAFSYLRVTFGEFAAFITGANLVMEYVVSNAAVARSFTAYFGTAIGVDTAERWRVTIPALPEGFNHLDFFAVAVVLLISLCICYSTKESSAVNMVLTWIHMVFIVFVVVVGLWKGDRRNLTEPAEPEVNPGGFFPYGAAGVFEGAAAVYLSYIGYDAVSTMAEEVVDPTRHIPIGVSGSVAVVTVIYCLMAVSMSLLVPYDAINIESPFSSVFLGSNGLGWASDVIGAGASFGILTSLIVSMMGQARYLCVIGRSNLVPVWLARVHPNTTTPVNASTFLGLLTASIALFTDLSILLNLVAIGTLFVFYMVANAVVYRRYVSSTTTTTTPQQMTTIKVTALFLLFFSFTALAFTLLYRFAPPCTARTLLLGGCAAAATAAVELFRRVAVPEAPKPEFWVVPAMPWTPAVSIFLNVLLLGSLDGPSFVRFGLFSGFAVLVYVFYGVHASFDAEEGEEGECESQTYMDDGYVLF